MFYNIHRRIIHHLSNYNLDIFQRFQMDTLCTYLGNDRTLQIFQQILIPFNKLCHFVGNDSSKINQSSQINKSIMIFTAFILFIITHINIMKVKHPRLSDARQKNTFYLLRHHRRSRAPFPCCRPDTHDMYWRTHRMLRLHRYSYKTDIRRLNFQHIECIDLCIDCMCQRCYNHSLGKYHPPHYRWGT